MLAISINLSVPVFEKSYGDGKETSSHSANLALNTSNSIPAKFDGVDLFRSAPWWHLNTVGKVGSALNILIGGLLSSVGGGLAAGGIRALIAKVGEAEAKKIVKNVVVNKVKNTLIAWGMSKIANGISNTLFQIIMWATDPGTAIAEWLDAHDEKPNNGYIEVW